MGQSCRGIERNQEGASQEPGNVSVHNETPAKMIRKYLVLKNREKIALKPESHPGNKTNIIGMATGSRCEIPGFTKPARIFNANVRRKFAAYFITQAQLCSHRRQPFTQPTGGVILTVDVSFEPWLKNQFLG